MKRILPTSIFLLLALCSTASFGGDAATAAPADAKVSVCFSPGGGCTKAVVDAIGKARKDILVQAYSFTSIPIAKALAEARKRGVTCNVILDKSQRTERYSEADFLVDAGINTLIDWRPKIAHSKVMVIDGATVITGSFNFTKSAESENVEIGRAHV